SPHNARQRVLPVSAGGGSGRCFADGGGGGAGPALSPASVGAPPSPRASPKGRRFRRLRCFPSVSSVQPEDLISCQAPKDERSNRMALTTEVKRYLVEHLAGRQPPI